MPTLRGLPLRQPISCKYNRLCTLCLPPKLLPAQVTLSTPTTNTKTFVRIALVAAYLALASAPSTNTLCRTFSAPLWGTCLRPNFQPLRDAQGAYFAIRTMLAAGATASLERIDDAAGEVRAQNLLNAPIHALASAPDQASSELARACYVGALATQPFRDACGIELSEVLGEHRVYGVLGLDDEAWR